MMAIAANSAARAGASAAEAADAAQALRRELKVWFAVDTLEFLRRGGRVGGAQAWLGSTLKIKPILSIESEILPVERVRTSGPRVRAARRVPAGAPRRRLRHVLRPAHPRRRSRRSGMVERGREIYGTDPEFVSEMGPVIGAHVGPGLMGVSGIPRRLLYPGG